MSRHIRKARLQDRTAPSRVPMAVSHAPHDDYWYRDMVRGGTTSGVVVTEELAMTYATVYACANKLSKTVATLPIHVKEHTGPETTRNAPEQPLDTLLRLKPNAEQTAVQFRESIMLNVVLWGNAYVFFRETPGGILIDMWILLSKYMTVRRNDQNDLVYDYAEPGLPRRQFTSSEILHIAGLGFDGTIGLSVIGWQRETVGVGLGATTHVSSFLENGAQPGIIIERPVDAPDLSKEGENNVLDSFDTRHKGSTKAWKTALLREGMTAKAVGIPLKDMEFVALRRYQKGDIAAIFDVPLTKIHENERDTFSNVEQKNIEWSTDSILPWCVRIENALDAKFFEGTPFFVKHNLEGIARGDMATRFEAYAIGIQWGFMLRNQVRELEGWNPIEGGDEPLVPMNMTTPDQLGEPPETTTPATPAAITDIHGPFRRLATEAAQRCVTKEVKAVGNAWKKHAKAGTVGDFVSWADNFYPGHGAYVVATLQPVIDEWGAVCGQGALGVVSDRDVCGNFMSVCNTARSDPASMPKLLEDLSETFAASLVADIEQRLTEGQ